MVLICTSIKMKLIIVNPYFPENNNISPPFMYFAQILLLLLLSYTAIYFTDYRVCLFFILGGFCCYFDTCLLAKS